MNKRQKIVIIVCAIAMASILIYAQMIKQAKGVVVDKTITLVFLTPESDVMKPIRFELDIKQIITEIAIVILLGSAIFVIFSFKRSDGR